MTKKRLAAAAVLAVTLNGATALASAHAAPPHRHPSYIVTAAVDTTAPAEGGVVKIKGSVRPAAPGARVRLEMRYVGLRRWRPVDETTISAASLYKFVEVVDTRRPRYYRVVKPAGPTRRVGWAKTSKVTVTSNEPSLVWRDVASLGMPAGDVGIEVADTSIDGVVYPRSLRQQPGSPDGGTITYNLPPGCVAFRGTVGLQDGSAPGGTATVTVSTDIQQRYSGSFGQARSAPVTFDFTGSSLNVSFFTSDGGLGAVGTPQVLCSP